MTELDASIVVDYLEDGNGIDTSVLVIDQGSNQMQTGNGKDTYITGRFRIPLLTMASSNLFYIVDFRVYREYSGAWYEEAKGSLLIKRVSATQYGVYAYARDVPGASGSYGSIANVDIGDFVWYQVIFSQTSTNGWTIYVDMYDNPIMDNTLSSTSQSGSAANNFDEIDLTMASRYRGDQMSNGEFFRAVVSPPVVASNYDTDWSSIDVVLTEPHEGMNHFDGLTSEEWKVIRETYELNHPAQTDKSIVPPLDLHLGGKIPTALSGGSTVIDSAALMETIRTNLEAMNVDWSDELTDMVTNYTEARALSIDDLVDILKVANTLTFDASTATVSGVNTLDGTYLSMVDVAQDILDQIDNVLTIPDVEKHADPGPDVMKHTQNLFADFSNNVIKPVFELVSDIPINALAIILQASGYLVEGVIQACANQLKSSGFLSGVVGPFLASFGTAIYDAFFESWFTIDVGAGIEWFLNDLLGLDDGATVYEPFTGVKIGDFSAFDAGDWVFSIPIPKAIKNWKLVDGVGDPPIWSPIEGVDIEIDASHRGGDIYASDILLAGLVYALVTIAMIYAGKNFAAIKGKLINLFSIFGGAATSVTMKALSPSIGDVIDDLDEIKTEIGHNDGNYLKTDVEDIDSNVEALVPVILALRNSVDELTAQLDALGLKVALGT